VLASLTVGASVVCSPGFSGPDFLSWLKRHEPTWYTAVPTMHQTILRMAKLHPDIVAENRLRLIRSSSSSLAPAVMDALEATFGAPVIESYGMTEAAHQMASNPLPPAKRKAGSVGIPAGPDIAIMAEAGAQLLPTGTVGEVVIRGANVTSGYLENPEANVKAFTDGWFRTGDQGRFDEDGYLVLTGRLKEIINRGGEKISPREIDEVLLTHPAIAQALAFAMPDPQLGEEIAAAVVLKPGENIDTASIQRYVADLLAPFKVPRRIVALDEIPKGPTGKLQRIGLAERLGLTVDATPNQQTSNAI
jgi:acyl-CoA synthetase (AMP-forming)/AMP-acid ligase II